MWRPLLLLVFLTAPCWSQHYEVPEPRLEALWPTGIRVSIPDSSGVELFAFHGSVNHPLRYLAAGEMSKDITRPREGRWVFEDMSVQLKPGDVVYYWLYVQVRGRGFQKTNLYWIIESFVTDSPGLVPLPQEKYTVPEALVEPLHPRGLRVSIPDSPGLEIFAFHGNVNKPMNSLEAGTMSRDVVRATAGRWVFEDPDVILKKGDTIYYWTYVIRNGLGYRRDNQKFVVNELLPAREHSSVRPMLPDIRDEKPIEPETMPSKENRCGYKEVQLSEGLEFKVVVKDGKLQMIPIIPDSYLRIAN